jgi:hypothetical protein
LQLSALHRVRESLVRDRTKTINQMHDFLLEFGISLPIGQAVITRLPAVLAEHLLLPRLIAILERLHAHFKYLSEQIRELDKELARQLADDEPAFCRYLASARSPQACWLPRSATASNTTAAGTSPHRSGWCHGNKAPAAKPTCSASANVATRISGVCSSSAHGPTCNGSRGRPVGSPFGFAPC